LLRSVVEALQNEPYNAPPFPAEPGFRLEFSRVFQMPHVAEHSDHGVAFLLSIS
jgi:hypothetical protein